MMTLAQMRAMTTRYLKDSSGQWSEDEYDQSLFLAADSLFNDLVADQYGRRCLRAFSTAAALVSEQEEYELPSDLILLDQVEVRPDADYAWTPLIYSNPPPPNGTLSLSVTSYFGIGGLRWSADTVEGFVRIWPGLTTIAAEQYRFQYFQRPAFPTDGEGTFNNPADEAGVALGFPEGLDICTVYLATAMLAMEELEDGKPIGSFGKMYMAKKQELCQGPAAGKIKRQRRYIMTGR